ncbi:hypothetical protein PtB15_1B707 [Puccinia triticina]|nr:hypothetical protein PtB15_1B707 [Puccinia triticina]
MKPIIAVSVAQLCFASGILGRTFTVRNNCPLTIWPAYFTNPDSPTQLTSQAAGWEAPRDSQASFQVPDGWAGRFWGRRNCDFSRPGPTSCATGGCNGGLVCDASTGSGVPPATLAELKLNGEGEKDFYDISNVDGYNLPVSISNNKECPAPTCRPDLNPDCPDERMKVKDAEGVVIGCLSACQANLDGTHDDSANCCTGSHDRPDTCPPNGVQHYDYFKGLAAIFLYATIFI